MKAHNKKHQILTLERYLPYRLSILSNKVSGIIAEHYKNKFALSVTEWRIMAVLGEYPHISADEVSSKTRIEKSLISRAVSRLLQRRLIMREVDGSDRRRSQLALTETGLAVYNDIVPLSYGYEQLLQQCFSEQERETFSRLIDRLYEHAGTIDV